MSLGDFEPDRYSVDELLTRRYYEIPRFQRPYSWDAVNVEDFWRDALEDNPSGYFIGPMVGWARLPEASLAYVVDGQQRLTTLSMLLAVIRDRFAEYGEDGLATGLQRYIERPDRDNESRFVLQTEGGRLNYLQRAILSHPTDQTAKPVDSDEARLASAYKYLTAKVVDRVTAATGERLERKAGIAALKKIRDQVLALKVIWVQHSNEDDAYIVFETLNSRGKDLETADLLKNLLLSRIRSTNKAADKAREEWADLREKLEQASIDINRYIQHWWLSQEAYVAQRKLFRAIKERVRTSPEAAGRLDSLRSDLPHYRAIIQPDSRRWRTEEVVVRDALEGLRIFGVIQPAPLLLAMLRAQALRTMKLASLRPTFVTIERFHFHFTAISAQSSTGGWSERYAKYARLITTAAKADDRADALRDFRELLNNGIPDAQTFTAAFTSRLVYTNEIARDKALVFYVLRRLHAARNKAHLANPSVEHIASQDGIASGADAQVLGNIGNLLWIDSGLNTRLANKTFAQKKAILATVRGDYDIEDILAANSWGQKEIEARAQRLAKLARDDVWKLPV